MPSSSDPTPFPARTRSASVFRAYGEGWRRAVGAPGIVLAVWLITIIVSLPFAAIVHDEIQTHLGPSAMSEQVLRGWNQDWAGEFLEQARGVSTTVTREILGAAGSVATVSRVFDGEAPPPAIGGAIALYLIGWVVLSGGIVDRLARGRPVGVSTFVALCGRYAFRLVRLAVVAGAAYWLLFGLVHPLLFETLFDRWTLNLASESNGLLLRLGLYVAFALMLGVVSLVVDVTRVRLVVEDRHSVLASIAAALRFVRRRFWRCSALYAVNIAGQVVLVGLWLFVAAGTSAAGVAALLVSQVYLIGRIWTRLAFLGSEAVFFQKELAHAHYTAAPVPRWPDSAAVEAIRNLRSR